MLIDEGNEFRKQRLGGPTRLREEDFRQLYPKLVALFRGKGADPEEASDLAQETLFAAYRGQAGFREESELHTWVFGIGKKQWLQHKRNGRRKKRAGVEVPVDEELSACAEVAVLRTAEPGPEQELLARDEYRRVVRTLPTLPEEMRLSLVMYVHAGLPYAEIGSRLGVSVNRVSSLIYQARQKLRRAAEGKADARRGVEHG